LRHARLQTEALKYYKKCLAIKEMHLTSSSPVLGITYSNLGGLSQDMGDLHAAEEYSE
jgi:hypothetical protein